MTTRSPAADPATTAALAACQRPRVTQPREPRRHRKARPGQEPVVFQLLQCRHHAPSAAMLLTGRMGDGQHVTVSVPDPEYTFYLQRAAPFADDADAAAFLAELEDLVVAHREDAFHVPAKGGDPACDRDEIFNPACYLVRRDGDDRAGVRVRGWARADGVFRTMYGWTPPEARLDNLLAVYVHEPRLVRLYTQFIDSDEYLAAVGADAGGPHPGHVVRAFQGSVVEPELRLRMAQGVTLGGWCALARYYVKPASFAPLHTDAFYVADGGMAALRGLPERTGTAPLRIASYDIEAAGRAGRFPVPVWTAKRLRDYLNRQRSVPTAQLDYAAGALRAAAIRAGLPRAVARDAAFDVLDAAILDHFRTYKAAGLTKRTFGTVKAMRDTLRREYPALKSALPPDRDTDPAFLIVYVEWTFGADRALSFSHQEALLFVHPEQEAPYDRPPRHRYVPAGSAAEAELDPKSLPDQYRRLPVREFATEAELILAFTGVLHARRPDIVSGWNTTTFDFPFLWERGEFLRAHGTPRERELLEAAGPLNFGLVRGGKSYAREETKSTNAGGDRNYLNVSTDFIAHLDGQVVWQNTSFGEREARGNKLDIVSEGRLVYPGTSVPRRKVEVDVTKGGEYWKAGGRWLWIFIAYCAVDARLPVQLLLAKGKIPLAVGLARLANVSLQAVYNNGLQMKVVSLIAQELYEHRGNRELLVEYGRRHLHWPDVWLRAEQAAGLHAATPDTPMAAEAAGSRKRPAEWDRPEVAAKRARTDVGGADPPAGTQPAEEPAEEPAGEPAEEPADGRGGMKRPREEPPVDPNPNLRKRLRRILHAKKRLRTANALDCDALAYVARAARFQPVPDGMKGYEGAHVFEPTRGLHLDAIATADFASLYPFIMVSHFLDYTTFLTSATIAHYGVPRHHYTAVPLGEADRIFCGETRYDPAEAAAQEYPTHKLKEAFFYADADNVMRNMLLRVYKQRKVYKGVMAQWKLHTRVLEVGADVAPWRADEDALPGADAYIENGRVVAQLRAAVEGGAESYATLYAEARAAAGGDDVADHAAAAAIESANANSSQLACKYIINGAYGFTTSSAKIAMVPLMEIGAAVTSYGRVCIRSSAYAANHLTVPQVIRAMKHQARTDLDALLEEELGLAPPPSPSRKRAREGGAERAEAPPPKRIRLTLEPGSGDLSAAELRAVHAEVYDKALYTHGGDTDSIMVAYPRAYAGSKTRDVVKLAEFVAGWIDQYMRDLMVLEQEKTSEQTIFFGRKNYLMDLFGTKILYKGFEPVRRDTLPFVRLTVVRAVEIILGKRPGPGRAAPAAEYADRLWDAVAHIRARLLELARGEVPIAELTQSQQIRKLVYASPPVVMGAVAKMQARGQRVEIGERVLFVFCRQPATAESERRVLTRKARSYIKPDKARDLADDVTHAIRHNAPIDYEFYYQNKVKNPLRKLLRPLLAPVADFPAAEIGMSAAELKAVEDRAKKVKKWQNVQVDRVLFGEVDAYFAQRRRLEYNRTLRRTQRQGALAVEYECPICANFFTQFSLARPTTAAARAPLCPGCTARKDALRAEAEAARAANAAATAKELATCEDCIARSGFAGDIQPSDCRKYFCSVFEAREALSIEKLQLRQRLKNLGVTDPAVLDW